MKAEDGWCYADAEGRQWIALAAGRHIAFKLGHFQYRRERELPGNQEVRSWDTEEEIQ